MSHTTADMQLVMHRLNLLEETITQLRALLATQSPTDETTTATDSPYIVLVADILSGEPILKGTRTPVRAVVEYWKFGLSPEEIARKLPHLRLAHIFAALSYYDDHRAEIEHYIALNRVPVDD
jgi:uncharacterized protein (DUF433 family)